MGRSRTWAIVAAAALAGPVVAGCGNSTGTGTTALSLRLTDAPGDLLEAWVGIDSVRLQGQSSASDQGGVTLLDQPSDLVDLKQLDGATLDLVKDVVVPSGTYAQLRIFVSRAVVVATDRLGQVVAYATGGAQLPAESQYTPVRTVALTCPSCAQSGLKVKLPGGSVELQGATKILVLDFDVQQSFGHLAGASDQWVMHPVMMASDFGASGTIAGRVDVDAQVAGIPDCPAGTARSVQDFVPTATLSTDASAVSSGTVQADSSYAIDFLAPATYLMGSEDTVAFDNDTLLFAATPSADQVTLASGDSATVDYTITSATCREH
jgi:hypothetical protein